MCSEVVKNLNKLLRRWTYAIEIDVFEVECMDVAWEVAVLFTCVSQDFFSTIFGQGGGKRLPKTGETDVDEQVSTASRDEENADWGDYGRRLSQHLERFHSRSSGGESMRVRV